MEQRGKMPAHLEAVNPSLWKICQRSGYPLVRRSAFETVRVNG
jgi:hypothetical protein